MNFSDLGLSEELLRAVDDAGYSEPTPIQAQAIPIVLMGRDVLGCAQTGTGKTASFTLPMIEILASGRAKARMPRSLILEPTRELAAQVADNSGYLHLRLQTIKVADNSGCLQLRLSTTQVADNSGCRQLRLPTTQVANNPGCRPLRLSTAQVVDN